MYRILLILSSIFLLTGCSTYFPCIEIGYISLRPTVVKDLPIPENADIAVYYQIDSDFKVNVLVENLTDDILTIDQTRSFFISPNNKSTSYYDPTIRTASNTTTAGTTSGGTFNFGGIANAFDIGGIAGSLMRSTTLGNSNSQVNSSTYTQIMADVPIVSIGPRGEMAMSKTFEANIGTLMNETISATPETSPAKFTVTICYSFDNGETSDIITTDFYINSFIKSHVYDRHTNDAVRNLLTTKPNATLEPWYKTWSSRGDGFKNHSLFLNYK